MRIDVHAHYWAASYIDKLVSLGRTDLAHAGRQRDDLDDRIAEMDKVGVQVQILSAIGLNTEVADPAGSAEAAAHINNVYADVVSRYGGRFSAFGSVPLPHVAEAIAESDRILADQRFTGIAMPCFYSGRPLDDSEFEPFWANVNEHDAVVYIHPVGSDSTAHPGLKDWGLHTAYGSPLQIAVAPIRLALSGVTTRYPRIRFIIAMCGGILPFLWPRHERNLRRGFEMSAVAAVGGGYFDWVKKLPVDPQDPMGLLRNFWYDTAIQDIPAALLVAKESYGADRLLLGSDAIFASLTEAVSYVEDSAYLSTEEKTAILDRNAQDLLGLPEPRLER